MYPEYAEINGKQYKLNTSWQNALECFDIINDATICDYERAVAIIYKIFGFIPENDFDEFLKKAEIFLSCGETQEQQKAKEKDMDFNQDRKYILASFMSDYKIDLSKQDMHFWEFIDLIQGLTNECSLSNLRQLRNFDVSQIKDEKERRKIIEAQKRVALKETHIKTEKEEEIDEFWNKITGGE